MSLSEEQSHSTDPTRKGQGEQWCVPSSFKLSSHRTLQPTQRMFTVGRLWGNLGALPGPEAWWDLEKGVVAFS